jgi:amidohydrolase
MRRLLTLIGIATAAAAPAAALDPALAEHINSEAERLAPKLIECRRWFHRHPELSNREHGTAAEIARRLREIGLEPREGIAGTGVVVLVEGALPGPVVAWRSDIDALPIEEAVDVPWRSENPGVMHACGHDVHLTIGLGTAELVAGMRGRLGGSVLFLFQPAEEGPPPGEEGGARLMLAEGVFDDPRPRAVFGLHVMPTLEVGTIGWRSGGIMAAADRFSITVRGRMTHGSTPHDGVDAVWVASQLVGALQGIAAREVDARSPTVVSVGSLHAGNRFNIIAGEAELTGTVRTLDPASREHVEAAMKRMVDGVCAAHRAECELAYARFSPPLVNDAALTGRAVASLETVLGPAAVQPTEPIMAAEDFAELALVLPGFYFHLGVGNQARGWTSYVHTPTFQPDERSIAVGVRAAAAVLLGELEAGRAAP